MYLSFCMWTLSILHEWHFSRRYGRYGKQAFAKYQRVELTRHIAPKLQTKWANARGSSSWSIRLCVVRHCTFLSLLQSCRVCAISPIRKRLAYPLHLCRSIPMRVKLSTPTPHCHAEETSDAASDAMRVISQKGELSPNGLCRVTVHSSTCFDLLRLSDA